MRLQQRALGLLALAGAVHGDALPYNPTRIFVPPNSSFAYIFQPSSQSINQAQLSTFNFGESFTAGKQDYSTVSQSLPFLQSNVQIPYTPSMDGSGNITVIAGDCSDGAEGAQVWQFQPDMSNSHGDGTWTQFKTSYQDLGDEEGVAGANYLSAGISFSDYVNGTDTNVYLFGGMCPLAGSTPTTWISEANYSNYMVSLSPETSGNSQSCQIDVSDSSGLPIAQAGSSMTALTPTYGMNSEGQAQTQQQDFVLLGGHTQEAFINMSQVGLFSLPQQSWAFVPVEQPSGSKTDLTVRQSGQVTPRSGHTAVLSESGDTIILFGGWVGSVNTAAQPQLAILELGSGYGGSGDWKWVVPDQSASSLAPGAGIYGHGAAMLPGGVMMIVGGYEIPNSASKRTERDTSQSINSHTFLYNTTSNSWLDSYSIPSRVSSGNKSPPLKKSQQVGLGAGLGLGAALLASVVGFYLWYGKRLQRARQDRERGLLSYSSDGSSMGQVEQPFLDLGGVDGRGSRDAAFGRFAPSDGQAADNYPRPPPMQHTTGMWVNVPSPTRGLRRGPMGKSYQYHPAPRYDDNRMSRGSGGIHPIAEQENEDDTASTSSKTERDGLTDAEAKLRALERVLNSDDPFIAHDPNPLGSHPVSSAGGDTVRRVPTHASRLSSVADESSGDAANWTVVGGSDEELDSARQGRVSPTKTDDRTSSTLSERSTVSSSSITRTMSTRTGAVLAAAAAAHRLATGQGNSSQNERSNTMSTNGSQGSYGYFKARARSSTNGSVNPGAPFTPGEDGDSIITTRSNFVEVQNEGVALLGGRAAVDPDDPYQRALAAAQGPSQSRGKPVSPTSSAPPPAIPPRRRPGLMGSLRRALNVVSMGERSTSMTASSEPYKDEFRSASSSPTKERPRRIGSSPRRAVSDGGALLRQKRGQRDWDEKEWPPYHDDPNAGDWGPTEARTSIDKRQAEEEWDVETAAANRDFQVMFTVPKARLRVVNDDMDRASLRSASDSALSRAGSINSRGLRRDDSVRTITARVEGDWPRLPSTEEEKEDAEKQKAA